MKSEFLFFRYPQYIMSLELTKIIMTIPDYQKRHIIDIPCGDGIISYWLKKRIPESKFELYDISEEKINRAKKYLSNMKIEMGDIFNIEIEGDNNIWLLINSLYCLPDKSRLLSQMNQKMEYIIGIFPNLDHPNYKVFMHKNPGFSNPSAMTVDETIQFFGQFNYSLLLKKELIHIQYYSYYFNKYAKHIFGYIFNLIDQSFCNSSCAYWIGIFKKNAI